MVRRFGTMAVESEVKDVEGCIEKPETYHGKGLVRGIPLERDFIFGVDGETVVVHEVLQRDEIERRVEVGRLFKIER